MKYTKMSDQERLDALQKEVGLNSGNYIVHHVNGAMSVFSDFSNGTIVKDLWVRLMGEDNISPFYNYTYDNKVDESHWENDTYRLVNDMRTLGHIHVFTSQTWYARELPAVRTPTKKSIRKGKAVPNELEYTTSLFIREANDVSDALKRYYIAVLLKEGFRELWESYIYPYSMDSKGNIMMPHTRVVSTPNGMYVSHPLCAKCGKDDGDCRMFYDYDKACAFADSQSKCFYCLPEKEQKRIEKAMEEYDGCDYEGDEDTGFYTECPLED